MPVHNGRKIKNVWWKWRDWCNHDAVSNKNDIFESHSIWDKETIMLPLRNKTICEFVSNISDTNVLFPIINRIHLINNFIMHDFYVV